MLSAATACNDPSSMDPDVDDGSAPLDIQALLWCLSSAGEGTTADGESVFVSFDDKHQLCVEKAIAKLECLASMSCELQWADLLRQDWPCYGAAVAESAACRPR